MGAGKARRHSGLLALAQSPLDLGITANQRARNVFVTLDMAPVDTGRGAAASGQLAWHRHLTPGPKKLLFESVPTSPQEGRGVEEIKAERKNLTLGHWG